MKSKSNPLIKSAGSCPVWLLSTLYACHSRVPLVPDTRLDGFFLPTHQVPRCLSSQQALSLLTFPSPGALALSHLDLWGAVHPGTQHGDLGRPWWGCCIWGNHLPTSDGLEPLVWQAAAFFHFHWGTGATPALAFKLRPSLLSFTWQGALPALWFSVTPGTFVPAASACGCAQNPVLAVLASLTTPGFCSVSHTRMSILLLKPNTFYFSLFIFCQSSLSVWNSGSASLLGHRELSCVKGQTVL